MRLHRGSARSRTTVEGTRSARRLAPRRFRRRRRRPLQVELSDGLTEQSTSNPTLPKLWRRPGSPRLAVIESRLSSFAHLPLEGGGQEWIRTTEGRASGFTVRPVWPLRYLPVHTERRRVRRSIRVCKANANRHCLSPKSGSLPALRSLNLKTVMGTGPRTHSGGLCVKAVPKRAGYGAPMGHLMTASGIARGKKTT